MVTTINRRVSLARYLLLMLALVAVPFPPTAGIAASPATPGCIASPPNVTGIYKEVCGRFADYWNSKGGLAQQGYPLTPEMTEISQEDGKPYLVQYFERAVFEYHPEQEDPDYEVLLSRLGYSFYRIKYPSGAPDQHANSGPDSRYFEATGKWLGGPFLQYWNDNGDLAQQGMPISDEFQEKSASDGQVYTVQYFERAVFEYHSELTTTNKVLLQLLGVFRLYSALVQPYSGYQGWICHPRHLHEYSNCLQGQLGGPDPESMPSEVAEGGPSPTASLAQPDDILLANADNPLPVRYATSSLTLMNATKLGLWQSSPCTASHGVTLLMGDPEDLKVFANPAEVVVNDGSIPLEVQVGNVCVHPLGTFYGVRLWPDGSADVAVKSGDQGALVIVPPGRRTRVLPGQQVHASPAGVVVAVGSIDAEFEKSFASHNDPSRPVSPPPSDPPQPPGWASSLLSNGDFETGTLATWTSQINGGSAFIATRPRRAGTYSARITSVAKAGANSGVAGGGTCPGGNRVPVVPSTSYSWSGWVFIPESDAQPGARLLINWYSACSGGSHVAVSGTSIAQATGQWLQITGQAFAPPNATHAAFIMEITSANNAEGSAYFDDLQLNVVGVLTPTHLSPLYLR
ncbi:MAG: hypothetical protein WCD37_01090 [Chloroflexia bacterium]